MRHICSLKISVALAMLTAGCQQEEIGKKASEKIIVEVLFTRSVYQKPANFVLKDKIEIEYTPIKRVNNSVTYLSQKSKVSNRRAKWITYSPEPLFMNYGFGVLNIVSPGDSILIKYDGKQSTFSGKGADKMEIWSQVMEIEKKMKPPTKDGFTINSLNDYLNWNKYVDDKLAQQIEIIDVQKDKLSPFEYNYLKEKAISSAEEDRISAFTTLKFYSEKEQSANLQCANFTAIWDTTQYKRWYNWLRSLSNYYGSMNSLYAFNRMEVERQFDFDQKNDSVRSEEIRTYLCYKNAKKQYKGLLRERLMAYIVQHAIEELGVKNTKTQDLLKDYYNQSKFPEYKQFVQVLEHKAK